MTNEVTCVRFRKVRLVARASVRACGLATLVGKAVANVRMLGKKRVTLKSKERCKPDGCTRKSFIVHLYDNERISVRDPAKLGASGAHATIIRRTDAWTWNQSEIVIKMVVEEFLGVAVVYRILKRY